MASDHEAEDIKPCGLLLLWHAWELAKYRHWNRVADWLVGVCAFATMQEVKTGDAARVRSLLARVTTLALPPKKMKGFFR